jgi:hypothetical protein
MMGVSKQAASEWKRKGLITLGPDGLLDPTQAARQLMRNADPQRLRAKVLKAAAADPAHLRQRLAATDAALADARRILERSVPVDDLADALGYLVEAIVEAWPHLSAARTEGADWLAARLDQLCEIMVLGASHEEVAIVLASYDLPPDPEPPAWLPAPPPTLHRHGTAGARRPNGVLDHA